MTDGSRGLLLTSAEQLPLGDSGLPGSFLPLAPDTSASILCLYYGRVVTPRDREESLLSMVFEMNTPFRWLTVKVEGGSPNLWFQGLGVAQTPTPVLFP